MTLSRYSIIILIIYFCGSFVFPVEYTDYEFEIFSLPIDARTNSLGGIAPLESMSISNIYSLNEFHKKNKTQFSYGRSYSDIINYFQISRIIAETNKTKFAVSFRHKKIDDIPYTKDAWEDRGYPITLADINYDNITTFSDQQIALILLCSSNLGFGNIGIKIKPFYTSILEHYSSGFSIDIGLNQTLSDNLMLGYSIENLLSVNNWSTGKSYALYPRCSFLISYSSKKHLLISEVDLLYNHKIKIGYENNIYKTIKTQIGYSSIKSISLGFSFEHENKLFSYSFTPNLNNIILGHDHQFSILLDLPINSNK